MEQVVALTSVFAANPQKQQAWAGFLRKHQLTGMDLDLMAVVEILQVFLIPVSAAVRRSKLFGGNWAGGRWTST